MRNLGSDLEQFDFQFLIRRALQKVPPGIDIREGSIIFDALAPACYELAEMYMQLRLYYQATFIQTAFDQYLDLIVAEQNLTRRQATPAVNLAYFENTDAEPFQGDLIGTVFATIGAENSIRYTVTDPHELGAGHYRLTCVEPGTIGNNYQGELIPISHINALGSVTMISNLIPGQNREDDESLRARFFEAINNRAFGGNVVQYRQEVMGIDGVSAVQIYPVWNGGGTVKVVILVGNFTVAPNDFINDVQIMLDPNTEGLGLGIAPIGHRVTVSTATERPVNVTVDVDLAVGITPSQMTTPINEAIEGYFDTVRRMWDRSNDLNEYNLSVFRSQLMVALLNIGGIINVSRVLIDDVDADLMLTQTGQLQELPIVGGVIINVN